LKLVVFAIATAGTTAGRTSCSAAAAAAAAHATATAHTHADADTAMLADVNSND
jgi:hypothetical protein